MADREDASVPPEPTWVANLRPRMERAFNRGERVIVGPYDIAAAIDHYEYWKAEAERLRAREAALRIAFHDLWGPNNVMVIGRGEHGVETRFESLDEALDRMVDAALNAPSVPHVCGPPCEEPICAFVRPRDSAT
jgi:hypothetical protein